MISSSCPLFPKGNPSHEGFAFRSRVWQEVDPIICYLAEQHRQNEDVFLEILTALRSGDIRRRHAEELLKRVEADLADVEVTELHTTNIDVDRINNQKLEALSGDEVTYEMHTTGADNYVETLKKSCLAPQVLRLKKGCISDGS